MGKRQQRLIGNIDLHIVKEWMHLPVTVIMKNAASFSGVIFKVEEDVLFVKDYSQHTHQFFLNVIAEIILEKESAY